MQALTFASHDLIRFTDSVYLVELLEQSAFDKKHVMQIFSQYVPTLYVQFSSAVEASTWIQVLWLNC